MAGEDAGVDEVAGDSHGGGGRPGSRLGLEQPQRPLLDGELDLHRVPERVFEGVQRGAQRLADRLGRRVEAGGRRRVAVAALGAGPKAQDRAGPTVFGVAGEGVAGAGGGAPVAEDHRLHRDGHALGQAGLAPVVAGAGGVVAREGRPHRLPHLLPGVLGGRLAVEGGAQQGPAGRGVRALGDGPGQARGGRAEHLLAVAPEEAHGGVEGEGAVLGGQRRQDGGGEAHVEEGFRQAGQGDGGVGAHRDEQRRGRVAEPAAGSGLQRVEGGVEGLGQGTLDLLAGFAPGGEGGGGEGEARGHRQAGLGGQRQPGGLVPDHPGVAAGAEGKDEGNRVGHARRLSEPPASRWKGAGGTGGG